MAVTVKQDEAIFDKALDFVQEAFTNANDGDLQAAARAGALRARHTRLVSGPLWDEMGEQILAQFFRMRRIHVLRRWSSGQGVPESRFLDAADHRGSNPLSSLYYVGGSWLRLAECVRASLYELRDARISQADGLMIEARFFERLAKGLKGDQKVADRYSDADLLRIRGEVEREQE